MAFLNIKAFLGLDGSGFALGMKRADSTAKQFAREFKGQMAKAFGVAALVTYTKKLTDLGDKYADLSLQTGVSTDALQEWGYAARRSNSSIDDVIKFFEKLAQSRDDAVQGNAEAIRSFSALGISIGDLKTQRLENIGKSIANTVKNNDVQDLIAPLKELGGRGAAGLIPTFKSGLDDAAQAAHDAGQVLSAETIVALDNMSESLVDLGDMALKPVAKIIEWISKGFIGLVDILKSGFFGLFSATEAFVTKILDAFTNAETVKDFIKGVITGDMSKNIIEDAVKAGVKAWNDVAFDVGMERVKRAEKNKNTAEGLRNPAIPTGSGLSGQNEKSSKYDYLWKAQKEGGGMQAPSLMRPNVNSLQQIGAAVLDKPMMTEAKKTNQILKKIQDNTDPQKSRNNLTDGNFGGVQF